MPTLTRKEQLIAKRVTKEVALALKKELTPLVKVDKASPMEFAVPFGFNQQMADTNRRQLNNYISVAPHVLRHMSVAHETTRAAINVRKRQITQLDWDIVNADPKIVDGDENQRKQLKQVITHIGGPSVRFRELLDKFIEDILVLDAMCFYKQKTRGGGVFRIIPIDSTTIKLRVDESGLTPMPPEIAYEQWIRGTKQAEMTTDEMVYESMNPRTNSPYGLSPLESLILTVDMSLRAGLYNLNYLSDNNVPQGFLSMPLQWTPAQIKEYKEFFDAMIASPKDQAKIYPIPSGTTYQATSKPSDFSFKEFFDYLDLKVAMLFDVAPQELGLNTKQYKENADSQEKIQMKKGIRPLAHFIEEIFTELIQNDLGYQDLVFKFSGIESRYDVDDAKALIPIGVLNIDEVRNDMGLPSLNTKNFVIAGNTPVPVDQIGVTVVSGTNQSQASPPNAPKTAETGKSDISAELRKWETKALNDIKKKGGVFRKFETSILDDETYRKIEKGLKNAVTVSDVKHVFHPIEKVNKNLSLEKAMTKPMFKKFKSAIRKALRNQLEPFTKEETIQAVSPSEKADKPVQGVDFGKYFTSIDIEGFDDYLEWAAVQGGEAAYSSLRINGSFKLTNDKFKQLFADRENYLIDSVDNTTKDFIIRTISEGKDNGMTNADIADQISENLDSITTGRADTIVNTEVANAMQTAELATYKDQGIEQKMWVTSEDDLVDPICEDLDQEVVNVEDEFSSGDDAPPAHPNCRCYIQVVLD